MKEQIVKVDLGFSGGYPAGTVVRWLNGIPLDWAGHYSPYAGPISDDIVTLDAAESIAAAHADTRPVPAPDRRLTSQDLWKRFPWSKNPETFDRAVTQHEFPRPLRLASTNLLSTEAAGFQWSEQAVNRWVAAVRVRLEQLKELVG